MLKCLTLQRNWGILLIGGRPKAPLISLHVMNLRWQLAKGNHIILAILRGTQDYLEYRLSIGVSEVTQVLNCLRVCTVIPAELKQKHVVILIAAAFLRFIPIAEVAAEPVRIIYSIIRLYGVMIPDDLAVRRNAEQLAFLYFDNLIFRKPRRLLPAHAGVILLCRTIPQKLYSGKRGDLSMKSY